MGRGKHLKLAFHAVTPDRWPDVEKLFGKNGACGGCWCMTWRLTRSEFASSKGAGNKKAFQKIVESGRAPGILAYADGRPVGWCAIAPRTDYPVLERSRVLAPIDTAQVWSVSCFFVSREYRRQGLTVGLLEAAVKHARSHGASIVEGYPHDLGETTLPAPFVWTGLLPIFRKAGFKEVGRRSPKRPIVRLALS
jgi:GNAT superfamily N-acetyltransferase